MTASAQSVGCMKTFWQSLEESAESSSSESSSFTMKSQESTTRSVNWMIENRGGFAKITGSLLVPSQFMGPDLETCRQMIDSASQSNLVEKVRLSYLDGVICYPSKWSPSDETRCVLYHNPNGVTLSQFFEAGELDWTPGEIMLLKKCPVILYDYLGTGLNQDESTNTFQRFHPTYESIVQDGLAALEFALDKFDKVDVWGSSLGGGVATASLERHLSTKPENFERVSITNHDSFTTTPRVVLPNHPWIADSLGWILGGNLDAQTPMSNLIERGVKITVLCHQKDPVIPPGARMAEFMSQYNKANISLIQSPQYGHANLSTDMIEVLREYV